MSLSKKKQNPKSPLLVMYVEVNNANFINAGCYSLEDGTPLIDIAIVFAANINYDTANRRAVLWLNENVSEVCLNAGTYIRPLQDKGIKVLLSILGNHQGAGVCNFPTQEAARDFAVQLAEAVQLFGLDGIDFDDEYAGYGQNGTGPPNDDSFLWLLYELRALIPDKIISFYFYGPASFRLDNGNLHASDYLDYSRNAMYGSYSPPNVPGLERDRLGPAAVWVRNTSEGTAASMAQRTISDGYGVYLCYDLPGSDVAGYLTAISNPLYGTTTNLAPGCLRPWPPASRKGFYYTLSSNKLHEKGEKK